ncbi:tRNA guanosine(34) transglycosylase Tgt [Candidatus Puniceispirillum sp.]|uniref:tRNA guanosine(34) transglycosylase Tgt n=1 Tax=Candidatus Puniceispirillum sp. TaxID=2026719 RepID=UPI003F69DF66
MTAFSYDLLTTDGAARRGRLHTAWGVVETPVFMPVGTAATVKGMMPESVKSTGASIILANTYHLMLRPGAERVGRLGGVRKMMGWDGPLLTDSGGFQVMSLGPLRKLDEDGVTFKSHLDGSKHRLTPERSTEIQHLLDATITMAFDECTPFPAEEAVAADSMRLSMRWAKRSRDAFVPREGYGQFGIVQGSIFADLRAESVAALTDIGFEGYAIGGLAVGEGQEAMFEALEFTTPLMLTDKPRYLMGVGKPSDLVGGVARGVDMFDCVLPTRSGRTGQGFTRRGPINIKNARHAEDNRPIDEACSCPACTRFSRAYLHHLFKADEVQGLMLLSWHNIQYYQDLMADMRAAIEAGRFAQFEKNFHAMQSLGDIDPLDP